MTERDLLNDLRMLASQQGGRLFRNNVAKGWVGRLISNHAGTVVLADARPLHAGLCIGSSDLIGWTADGRFLAVEAKTGRLRLTPEQAAFLDAVNSCGGIGILARTTADLAQKIAPPGGDQAGR